MTEPRPTARLYLCDDEPLIRAWLETHLLEQGYEVRAFETGTSLVEAFRDQSADLVLLDLRLPDGTGLEFLQGLRQLDSTLPVIMMSAFGEVEIAVAAVREGAHHFLEKPIELAELLILIDSALERRRLVGELDRYRAESRWRFSDVTVVGRSQAMSDIVQLISRIGERATPSTILISGESGSGKEVVARAIHARGPRQGKPFLTVNCTVLPENLVESELFGHEAGAFTDARKQKKGLFELAEGGTLLLDEIGDMPAAAQATLLQVLETREFRRVGGVRGLAVDVHVVAATHRDLALAVEQGKFREDLFYRLNVLPIRIPPLRERPEDIAPLALHFTEVLCGDMGIEQRALSADALTALERYRWPGNARQLRNVIERTLMLHDKPTIELEHLPDEVLGETDNTQAVVLPSVGLQLAEVERDLIVQALARAKGNKSEAARLLGISRDTLRYRLEKYGVDPSS